MADPAPVALPFSRPCDLTPAISVTPVDVRATAVLAPAQAAGAEVCSDDLACRIAVGGFGHGLLPAADGEHDERQDAQPQDHRDESVFSAVVSDCFVLSTP